MVAIGNEEAQFIEYRTLRYFEQADCALLTLRQLFEEMKSRDIFDRAYIVLHGDHGSQVSKNYPAVQNIETLTVDDYRAHYSTLFAVKSPFGEFELDPRALPISTLLEEFSKTFADTEHGQNIDAGLPEKLLENENKPVPFV